MRSGSASYWSHWLIIAGGLFFFVLLAKVLPVSWERIDLPQKRDTLILPAWGGPPLVAGVPPPLRATRSALVDTSSLPGDTASERVLLVGDSMTEWLRLRLARLCHAQGYALYSVIWPSSNLVWWGRSDTLAAFIRRLKPTYVLLCIGSNELFIPGIKRRRPYVERILSQVGSLPFVWIGPPNWKEDTGINAMLQEVAGPGRFFDSRRLTYERLEDGAHPTPTSAYRWADSIAAFLRDSALYPLLLPDKLPADKVARPDLSFFLQPNEP